jgi:ATP-dependent RNA helicase RhlE
MTFEDLNIKTPVLNALKDMGLETPTTIQERAYSVVMSGRDVVGIAQTGTGKTLAYLLPCLRQWTFSKDVAPQILILVPTRELAVQVLEQVKKLTAYMSVRAEAVYGGVNINTQAKLIENGLDVLVATPGRLIDFLMRGTVKTKAIKHLVIDEVDEMLQLGFRPQLTTILDLLPPKRQNLLFSATMPDEVEALIVTFFNHPIKIEAAPTGTPLENIEQYGYAVPNFNTKVNLLEILLSETKKLSRVLVFVATKKMADALYEKLALKFPEAIGVIHSNKDQGYRFRSVNNFKDGTFRVLIATDIIARGLDISDVTHVINFDVSDVPENHIHRIGRTGRYDKRGTAITLISDREKENLEAIEALMKMKISLHDLPEDLEISDVLIYDEMPVIKMPIGKARTPKREVVGPAFHEKSAKNQKVNVKIRHADVMKAKYGKPKKRKPKDRQ